MSYQASYDQIKLRQVTSARQYPDGLHYVVIIFNSNKDSRVYVTSDLDEWKANIKVFHDKGCDFVFYKVEKLGNLSVKTIITIE